TRAARPATAQTPDPCSSCATPLSRRNIDGRGKSLTALDGSSSAARWAATTQKPGLRESKCVLGTGQPREAAGVTSESAPAIGESLAGEDRSAHHDMNFQQRLVWGMDRSAIDWRPGFAPTRLPAPVIWAELAGHLARRLH